VSVGDSDVISSAEVQLIVSSFSNSDTFISSDLNIILSPISSDGLTFFDTGQILIGVIDSDVHGFTEGQKVGPLGSDFIFAGGTETNLISSTISSSESMSSLETYGLGIIGTDIISSAESSFVGVHSNEIISSNFSETQSVLFSSSDSLSSNEQDTIIGNVNSSQTYSSVDDGSIGFSLVSGDFLFSSDSNTYSSLAFSSDQGFFTEIYWALGIFLSDIVVGNDNMILNFLSSDSISSSDSVYNETIFVFDTENISGSDTSIIIIDSDITLEWNVDMLIPYRVFSVGKLYSRGV
jgi:hypothetical protein